MKKSIAWRRRRGKEVVILLGLCFIIAISLLTRLNFTGPAVEDPSYGARMFLHEVKECPKMALLSGQEFHNAGNMIMLPCGLLPGSSITVVGKPTKGHPQVVENMPNVLVSQFIIELQGPIMNSPRLLHFNPRLTGNSSIEPVIELNTFFAGEWGIPQRCEGWLDDQVLVDGLPKCQSWSQHHNDTSHALEPTAWSNWHSEKPIGEWSYPFVEDRLFVLTIRAGQEGYSIHVDGEHIASFPYRMDFIREEAFAVSGDIKVHSVVAPFRASHR